MIQKFNNKLNKSFPLNDVHSLECTSNNGCISLNRTNVRLSGNHKLVHKTDDELFIESISSDDYLSRSMFKAFNVDTSQTYAFNLFQFFNQSSKNDSIWHVHTEEPIKASKFTEQYTNTYKWGAYTESNDIIGNQFRFFAPLWTYGSLPDKFLIFRVKNNSYSTVREYIDNCELIKVVDLSIQSNFGKYLHTLTDDINFKQSCIQTNFNESKISYYGIDINSGKFKYNTESDLDSYLANERTITEFNNSLTNGFMRGNLLCANLLNLEFSFNDLTAPIGFNNYIGLYAYDNEIDEITANKLKHKSGVIVLNHADDEIKLYRNGDTKIPDYKKTIKTTNALQTAKNELYPIIEIKLPFAPIPSSVITIEYNDITEFEMYMVGDILTASTTQEVLNLIANEINNTTFENIIITASVVDDTLIIKSELINYDYEKIVVKLPPVFQTTKPKYYIDINNLSNDELYSSLRMIGMQDLVVSTFDFDDSTEFVEIDNKDYTLLKTFSYRDASVMRLDESFKSVEILNSSVITFKKIIKSKFNVLSYIKHCDFDMSMLTTPYYDIYDFDMISYQKAFGKQMEPIFRRYETNAHTQLDLEIIDAYKSYFKIPLNTENSSLYTINENNELNVIINNALSVLPNKEVLIRDFDELTLYPSNTCKNEFERLQENILSEIKNVNILEPQICKFACVNGLDSYNNPISLNISLTHRNDNFLSTSYYDRSVINNTHSWFIMGAGPTPYVNVDNEVRAIHYLNSVQKQCGYANVPYVSNKKYHSITLNLLNNEFDPTNTKFDVFELLKYRVNNNINPSENEFYNHSAWSYMYKVDGEDRYNTIFRGIEYSFNGDYPGYRFAVVLVTEPNADKNNTLISPFNLVDNTVFKTLTLVINFYISDKILSSFNGKLPYYLDRSFFYYADKVYLPSSMDIISEIESSELISLNLFETSVKKSDSDISGEHVYKNNAPVLYQFNNTGYRGTSVEHTIRKINNWFTVDEYNKPIFYIGLNQLVTDGHGQSFKEIIKTNTINEKIKFEWMYVTELEDSSVSMLIRFTAYDIVEIQDNYIWCRDIFTEFIINNVYLEDYNENGEKSHIILTLDDIINNGSESITIDGITYKIPFWEKISTSQFMELPISDSNGIRRGLRLTKEFYEEVDSRYTYPNNLNQFIKTVPQTGKRFITFDEVYYETDKDYEKDFRIDLSAKSGKMLEQDQYWFISKSISKQNSMFLNIQSTQAVSKYKYLTSAYVRDLFNMYAIKTFIATETDLIETTKNIEMLSPSETYIIVSLKWDSESKNIVRENIRKSFPIKRLDGEYAPIFKRIMQPYSIVVDNIEFENCQLPLKLNPIHTGRRICTNDNIDNYCEEFLDNGLKNIYDSHFYTAIYNNKEVNVIADASLSEFRGFISNTYNNNSIVEIKVPWANEIDLIEATREMFGSMFTKYTILETVNTVDMINALRLYNKDLRDSNIIYENFYKLFYKHFYEEFLYKYYKVIEVITNNGTKIDFYYENFNTISLKATNETANMVVIKLQKN